MCAIAIPSLISIIWFGENLQIEANFEAPKGSCI